MEIQAGFLVLGVDERHKVMDGNNLVWVLVIIIAFLDVN
jgi:hypothetical protein